MTLQQGAKARLEHRHLRPDTMHRQLLNACRGPLFRGHRRRLIRRLPLPLSRMVCSCFSFKKYIVFVYVCIYARAGVGNASDLNLIAIGCTTKAVFSLFFGSIFTLHLLIHRSALGEIVIPLGTCRTKRHPTRATRAEALSPSYFCTTKHHINFSELKKTPQASNV